MPGYSDLLDTLTNKFVGRASPPVVSLQPLIQSALATKKKPSAAIGYDPSIGGDTNAQLKAGFLDAGRPDLAAAVGTAAFNKWIGAESGGRVDRVSAANNQGKPNGGLFQIWYGHPWAQQYFQGGRFTASPYEQARLVSQYFGHLTPQKISGYAAQIAAGRYKGWG